MCREDSIRFLECGHIQLTKLECQQHLAYAHSSRRREEKRGFWSNLFGSDKSSRSGRAPVCKDQYPVHTQFPGICKSCMQKRLNGPNYGNKSQATHRSQEEAGRTGTLSHNRQQKKESSSKSRSKTSSKNKKSRHEERPGREDRNRRVENLPINWETWDMAGRNRDAQLSQTQPQHRSQRTYTQPPNRIPAPAPAPAPLKTSYTSGQHPPLSPVSPLTPVRETRTFGVNERYNLRTGMWEEYQPRPALYHPQPTWSRKPDVLRNERRALHSESEPRYLETFQFKPHIEEHYSQFRLSSHADIHFQPTTYSSASTGRNLTDPERMWMGVNNLDLIL